MGRCKTEMERTRYDHRIYTLPSHENENSNSILQLPVIEIFPCIGWSGGHAVHGVIHTPGAGNN